MSIKTSKEKILNEAIKLFAKHGYFAVSMFEIAEKANMTKSNLYHHFVSKEDLYMQLIKKTFDDLLILMLSYQGKFGNTSFKKAFREFIEGYIKFGINNKDLIYMLIQNISRLDNDISQYLYNSRKKIISQFKEYLLIGIKSGEIKNNLNPEKSALILHGLLNVTILQKMRMDNSSKSNISQIVEEIYKWLE